MEYLLEALPLYKMILFHCIYWKSQKVNSSRSFQRVEKRGLKIQIHDKMCYKVTTGLGHEHNKLQNRQSQQHIGCMLRTKCTQHL